jgi:hypothetical protein
MRGIKLGKIIIEGLSSSESDTDKHLSIGELRATVTSRMLCRSRLHCSPLAPTLGKGYSDAAIVRQRDLNPDHLDRIASEEWLNHFQDEDPKDE